MAIGGGIDRSLDQIKDAVDVLYEDANRDEELRNWFKQVNQYARKVLLQPGYVLEPACDSEGVGSTKTAVTSMTINTGATSTTSSVCVRFF
jgi:hypothetical protein